MKAIIAAIGRNETGDFRVIGRKGQLPWAIRDIPAEMKNFRQLTIGQTVIMGRATYQSLSVRPLPNRVNIVLSRRPLVLAGSQVASSVREALQLVKTPKVFFVGGAQIYEEALPLVDYLYLTYVDHCFTGDRFFPPVDWVDWKEVSRQIISADDQNHYDLNFVVYERRRLKNEAIPRAA